MNRGRGAGKGGDREEVARENDRSAMILGSGCLSIAGKRFLAKALN